MSTIKQTLWLDAVERLWRGRRHRLTGPVATLGAVRRALSGDVTAKNWKE